MLHSLNVSLISVLALEQFWIIVMREGMISVLVRVSYFILSLIILSWSTAHLPSRSSFILNLGFNEISLCFPAQAVLWLRSIFGFSVLISRLSANTVFSCWTLGSLINFLSVKLLLCANINSDCFSSCCYINFALWISLACLSSCSNWIFSSDRDLNSLFDMYFW